MALAARLLDEGLILVASRRSLLGKELPDERSDFKVLLSIKTACNGFLTTIFFKFKTPLQTSSSFASLVKRGTGQAVEQQ
jgi:hypothetical protein